MAPPSAPSPAAPSPPPPCCVHSASQISTPRPRRDKAKPSCSDKTPCPLSENQWVSRPNVKHALAVAGERHFFRDSGTHCIHPRLVEAGMDMHLSAVWNS